MNGINNHTNIETESKFICDVGEGFQENDIYHNNINAKVTYAINAPFRKLIFFQETRSNDTAIFVIIDMEYLYITFLKNKQAQDHTFTKDDTIFFDHDCIDIKKITSITIKAQQNWRLRFVFYEILIYFFFIL